ncbi:cystathionine beta-lyase [Penicillium malachiteum]|uniref:cystathionine beta-lyase n=1 Tax=Penicillium malachiteum TaxID=1324776 RepID=UPI002547AF76|nr:cystathionine beta-lyase [Penicillium malachiteum]KAJ5728854.1 cystathionine beta-lyase [Penicillium malachiteum]
MNSDSSTAEYFASAATAKTISTALSNVTMSTSAIHVDDFASAHKGIAPAIHVAVNYRYDRDPANLVPGENRDPHNPENSFVYSRYSAPNSSRFEMVLKEIFGGKVMTYSTGLAAFHAIMVLLNPKRVFIDDGYHGVHAKIDLMTKLTGVKKYNLDQLEYLAAGDVIHIETPAHEAGAYLNVDATFGPPPLQDPLHLGADIVMHSGTKYIGGHSDMMCGILVVHSMRVDRGWYKTLYSQRMVMGNVMGNLEGWLGLRSLRTLEIRVKRQSDTAKTLVEWIHRELQNPDSDISRVVESIKTCIVAGGGYQRGVADTSNA